MKKSAEMEQLKKRLEKKIRKKLNDSGFKNIEITFLSPEKMAELNRIYLGRKGPATIITFPYRDALPGEAEVEIFLCMEEIIKQAQLTGAPLDDYFQKIAIHILHSVQK